MGGTSFIAPPAFDKLSYKTACVNCDHAYYVYGCEFNCERINKDQACSFTIKDRPACPPGMNCDMLDTVPNCAECWEIYRRAKHDSYSVKDKHSNINITIKADYDFQNKD